MPGDREQSTTVNKQNSPCCNLSIPFHRKSKQERYFWFNLKQMFSLGCKLGNCFIHIFLILPIVLMQIHSSYMNQLKMAHRKMDKLALQLLCRGARF